MPAQAAGSRDYSAILLADQSGGWSTLKLSHNGFCARRLGVKRWGTAGTVLRWSTLPSKQLEIHLDIDGDDDGFAVALGGNEAPLRDAIYGVLTRCSVK